MDDLCATLSFLLAPLAALAPASTAQDVRDHIPGEADASAGAAVLESLAGLDPALGGWEGEILLERMGPSLTALKAALSGKRSIPEVVAEIAEDEVRVPDQFGPMLLERNGPFWRGTAGGSLEAGVLSGKLGLEEFLERLSQLAIRDAPRAARVKIKVISVELAQDAATTIVRIEIAEPRGPAQVVARAELEWSLDGEGAPRLRALAALVAEVVRADSGPLFEDVTDAVLGSERTRAQLAPGISHWRERIDSALGIGLLGHQGLALGDIDGDGLEDLYLCQPGGLPNLLFLHQADGTALEVGAMAGVDVLDATTSALLIDFDGDRDLDLALAVGDEIALFENAGEGGFRARALLPAEGAVALSAADFNGDGWVDLFVTAYLGPYEQDGLPLPYHDAENGAPNHLLANRGDFEFVDASEAAGLRTVPARFSFAASWEDFDRDGDPDLYVANDFGRNELWRNEGGRFDEVAAELGIEDLSAGMGVTWGDFDRDGWPDLYVSNMFSSAGNRVAYGRTFRKDIEPDSPGEIESYRRHARGNSLFRNLAGKGFEDVSLEAGVTMGRWAWGALCVELDNDGRPDLVVPNGFVTNTRDDDL